MKTIARLSPNENTPTIAFEAKIGIRKENSPPLMTRPVDMLTCLPQTFLAMERLQKGIKVAAYEEAVMDMELVKDVLVPNIASSYL
ncbi:hypothetical protein TNCV_4461821 [Trichonephila clavipes]|nr:hypothetical protein TNCV_4461821 [Trichonephila clavipes]